MQHQLVPKCLPNSYGDRFIPRRYTNSNKLQQEFTFKYNAATILDVDIIDTVRKYILKLIERKVLSILLNCCPETSSMLLAYKWPQ